MLETRLIESEPSRPVVPILVVIPDVQQFFIDQALYRPFYSGRTPKRKEFLNIARALIGPTSAFMRIGRGGADPKLNLQEQDTFVQTDFLRKLRAEARRNWIIEDEDRWIHGTAVTKTPRGPVLAQRDYH